MRRAQIQSRPLYERVKGHVERSGLGQAQIAHEAGWSEKRLQRLLNGDTNLLAVDMETLARVLRKPVAELYKDPKNPARS